jgi:hypothetical protein
MAAGAVWRLRCGVAADIIMLWLGGTRPSLIREGMCASLAAKYRLLADHHRHLGNSVHATKLDQKAQSLLRLGGEDDDEALLVPVGTREPRRPRPSLGAASPLPEAPLSIDAHGGKAGMKRGTG